MPKGLHPTCADIPDEIFYRAVQFVDKERECLKHLGVGDKQAHHKCHKKALWLRKQFEETVLSLVDCECKRRKK